MTDKFENGTPFTCARCEAAISDAIDDLLPAEHRQAMDLHLATCAACSDLHAEARRGQAWLDVLKASRPEPPASLAMRIISQTSGAGVLPAITPAMTPAIAGESNVLPMRLSGRRTTAPIWAAVRNVLYQPRLAMTAAMAFFSISMTLSLTGIKLNELHLADLQPGHLQRQFYQADAQVIRYYDNLHVVNEFESNVQQLISTPAGGQNSSPGTPDRNTPQQPDPNGSSRRETAPTGRFAAALQQFDMKNFVTDTFERNIA